MPDFRENIDRLTEVNQRSSDREKERKQIFDNFATQLYHAVKKDSLTNAQADEYFALLSKCHRCFGLEQSLARMSKLKRMTVKLKPNAKSIKMTPRQMNQIRKKALRMKMRALMAMRMIKRCEDSFFASPVFLVPKKNRKWRLDVYMSLLNQQVEAQACNMPTIETQPSCLPGHRAFLASFDNICRFDLLNVLIEGQQYFGISTMYGTFVMFRAPMGFLNIPTTYQERMMREILGTLTDNELFGAKE